MCPAAKAPGIEEKVAARLEDRLSKVLTTDKQKAFLRNRMAGMTRMVSERPRPSQLNGSPCMSPGRGILGTLGLPRGGIPQRRDCAHRFPAHAESGE